MSYYDEYIVPSIWDRLMDDNPDVKRENLSACNISDMKKMVLRDLINLFNARRFHWRNIDKQSLLQESLLFYGLPDINSMSGRRREDLQTLRQEMERSIENFEPRLSHARVKMLKMESMTNNLQFVIDAQLNIEPTPVPVQVNTTFETSLQRFTE